MDFPLYFSTVPEGEFTPDLLDEARVLEAKPLLSLYEKRRLVELYTQELKTLKASSPHAAKIKESLAPLQAEVAELSKAESTVREEVRRYKDPTETTPTAPLVFEHASLKKAFREVYRLWNRDQNEQALKKLDDVLAGDAFQKEATTTERYKAFGMEFRISLEVNDDKRAAQAYQAMHQIEDCSELTAQTGFLYALRVLSQGEKKKALEIFSAQCDPDKSVSHHLQRTYWLARFTEAAGEDATAIYREVAASHLPSYYVYLAKRRQADSVQLLPLASSGRLYLSQPLRVSGEVHQCLVEAETRLGANLRRDASVYLTKATQRLKENVGPEDILPLLYVARLQQAAGNHLEAMKIYTVVTSLFDETPLADQVDNEDFLSDMFPRPFPATVEWLAHEWSIDPDFTYAIMRQESAFNPGALSGAHARGLMQLLPSLAKSLSKQWGYQSFYSDRLLLHARENLKLASYHLYRLGSVAPHLVLTAAAYNAGLARVSGWWRKFGELPVDAFVELIPVNETRNYVKLVLRNYLYYKALRSKGTLEAGVVPLQLPPFSASHPTLSSRRPARVRPVKLVEKAKPKARKPKPHVRTATVHPAPRKARRRG